MQTFTKAERLSSKIIIEKLYESGKSIQSPPFKINWMEAPQSNVRVKVIISVPKRLFKKAVDRNKLKRLIREAYRKNKNVLYEGIDTKNIFLMIIYTSKTLENYRDIEKGILTTFKKICKIF